MYKCLIIDDEPLARELLETYLSKLSDFELIASCKSALEASSILNSDPIDLIFLDINMPVLKGTDFFKNLLRKPKVIFTTAYREYAVEGFELNAIDYLLKPIVFDRFFMAIQKFLESLNRQAIITNPSTQENLLHKHVFVSKGHKQLKVMFDDVLYIESFKDYVKIHSINSSSLMIKESISSIEQRIDKRFVRVHRSYIINSHKITAYTKNDIEIGKFEIPIGGNYKATLDITLFQNI